MSEILEKYGRVVNVDKQTFLEQKLMEVFTVVCQTLAMHGATCSECMLLGSNGCALHHLNQSKHVSEMNRKLPH